MSTATPATQAAPHAGITPLQAPPAEPARRDYRRRDLFFYPVLGWGVSSIEAMSSTMIPITMRHFFESKTVIAILIDLNRLFGFLVQPYVAARGDTLRSPLGRRRPFLMFGLPVTMFFMLLAGLSPVLFPGPIGSHALPVLAFIFFLNVCMQACQDINSGSDGPLFAEIFPRRLLGRANSIKANMAACFALFMAFVTWPLADKNEFYPYLIAAGFITLSLLMVIFGIRERPAPPLTAARAAEKYNVKRHARMLIENVEYAKLAVLGSVNLANGAAWGLFLSLLVKEELHMTMMQFGKAIWVGPIVAFVFAVPIGWLADRVGPKYMVATGFFVKGLSAFCIIFYVKDVATLQHVVVLNAIGYQLVTVAMAPLMFQNVPLADTGKVWGLVQFVRAGSAFIITPLVGMLADVTGSYRAGYYVCVGLTTLGAIVAMSTRKKAPPDQAAPAEVEVG